MKYKKILFIFLIITILVFNSNLLANTNPKKKLKYPYKKESESRYIFDFQKEKKISYENYYILIDYDFDFKKEGDFFPKKRDNYKPIIKLKFKDGNSLEKEALLKPNHFNKKVYIYFVLIDFFPKEMIVEFETRLDFDIKYISIEQYKIGDTKYQDYYQKAIDKKEEIFLPLDMDLGSFFIYPYQKWRHQDFEYIRWNALQSVLAFNFKTLDIQSDFLKRIAFFTEKPGYRGTIPKEEEVKDKHGWNAHDYSSQSLADFFNEAKKSNVILNLKESFLKELLLKNNIIYYLNDKYLGARNKSIISCSYQVLPNVRRKLLTHESFHGIYFHDIIFRKDTEYYYKKAFSDDDRYYFVQFFSSMEYDDSFEELMVNEFQAYTLQQSYEEVDNFFRKNAMYSIIEKKDLKIISKIEKYLSENNKVFLKASEFLNKFIYNKYGFYGGDVFELEFL